MISSGVIRSKAVFRASCSLSIVRAFSFRSIALMYAHISSIGFKSGEYFGRYQTFMLHFFTISLTDFAQCTEQLSMSNISSSANVGATCVFKYSPNTSLFSVPSNTIGIISPLSLMVESMLSRSNRTSITPSFTRSPDGPHPYKRVIARFTELSSSTTIFPASSFGCASSRHISRLSTTSSLSCPFGCVVFF